MDDDELSVVEEAVDPQLPQPVAEEAPKRQKKKESRFSEIHKQLSTVDGVILYVNDEKRSLKNAKHMNLVLQALSGKDTSMLEELFVTQGKPQMLLLLTLMYDQFQRPGTGGDKLTPFHQEFLIRGEYFGMKKSSWMEGVSVIQVDSDAAKNGGGKKGKSQKSVAAAATEKPEDEDDGAVDHAQLPNSPKEMLTFLTALDVKGNYARRIELSRGVDDLRWTIKKFSNSSFTDLSPPDQISLTMKLLSKVRNVFLPAAREEKEDGAEGSKATRKRSRESDDAEGKAVQAAPAGRNSGRHSNGPEAADLPVPVGAPEILGPVVDLCHRLFSSATTIGVAAPAKVTAFLKSVRHLVPKTHLKAMEEILSVTETKIASQVSQLEAVMALKGCKDDDDFKTVLQSIVTTDSDGTKLLTLTSPDVLSALAVAAEKRSALMRKRVVNLLAAVQADIQRSGAGFLPRRALNFVVEERARERRKQVSAKAAAASGNATAPAAEEEEYNEEEVNQY